MSSLKKYWFGVNRENKPQCAKVFDSSESIVTSVTQPTNVSALPDKLADCEQLLNHQCSVKSASTEATIIAIETPTQQNRSTDSNSTNASAASLPSLISQSSSQIILENTLQKSTAKKKSAAGGKKTGATEKKGSTTAKKGAAAKKKGSVTEKKDAAADKKGSTTAKKGAAAGKKGSITEKKGAAAKKKESITEKKSPAAKKKESITEKKGAAAKKKGSVTEKTDAAAKKKGSATEKKGAPTKGEKKAPKKASTTLSKKAVTTKEPEEPQTPETTTTTPEEIKPESVVDTEKPIVPEVKTEPAAAEEVPSVATAESDTARDKTDAPTEKSAVGAETTPGTRKKVKGAKAVGSDEPTVGEEGSPARKKGKATKPGITKEPKPGITKEPKPDEEAKRKRKGATDAEEPVAEEGKERRRKPEDKVESAVGEEKSPGPGGRAHPPRRRLRDLTTQKVITSTPATTISSLYTPRRIAEKRIPFSRPLTFSARTSPLVSLSEDERRQSTFHEEQLLRAWRLPERRLMKMLPTPMRRPMFLRDAPDMSYENTVTTELRSNYAKRKIEAMQKPPLELVRDPLMLRFIQPKTNKSEILRKKHIRKEAIMSAYFEQHYDRFQKPPFKNIQTERKCVIY